MKEKIADSDNINEISDLNLKRNDKKSQNKIYWIWLQLCLGFGSARVLFFVRYGISIEFFCEQDESYWVSFGVFSKKEIKSFRTIKLKDAIKILDICERQNVIIITFEDSRYPELLKSIINPPCVLYVRGDLDLFRHEIPIAIVGSRSSTFYGNETAYQYSADITLEGGLVVSGGALGIDTFAHNGALKNGKTIAVLACGIDFPYLMTNKTLRNQISNSGLLVSEYPPDFEMRNYNFILRNRLISGLSLGIIVVEAGKRSGALITANLAIEQNRDVFTVPISPNNPMSDGIFDLIRDGAKVIKNPKDVVEYYKFNKIQHNFVSLFRKNNNILSKKFSNPLGKNTSEIITSHIDDIQQNKDKILESQSDEIKTIYKILLKISSKDAVHINKLKELSNLEMKIILSSITKMEILGLIKKHSGNLISLDQKIPMN